MLVLFIADFKRSIAGFGPAPHGPRTGRNKVHNYGDEPW